MKVFIIICLIITLLFNYISIFTLAKASSNLHRMEERWEKQKETQSDQEINQETD